MATQNGGQSALTAASAQANFEQAIVLSLHTWPALSLAVQNGWGGEASTDKRDWFAGAVSDLFAPFDRISPGGVATPSPTATAPAAEDTDAPYEEPDADYVEEFLLQVMADEFEVNVDDDSAHEVARQVVKLRGDCARGRLADLDALRARWESKKGKAVQAQAVDGGNQEVDSDDDDDDDADDDGDNRAPGQGGGKLNWADDFDDDMTDAPQLVSAAPKEKPQPEVDDDGFTKVVRKK